MNIGLLRPAPSFIIPPLARRNRDAPGEDVFMKVPLLDLTGQYAGIKADVDRAVAEVFASQYFILGPKVQACEAAVAAYCGTSHAVGVSSGTDALLIALMAEHIGPGDEVITSPYSFFATAGSIARTGATPVFVDIDPVTFNLDPDRLEAAITPRTRAIIPVHLYGQCARMDPILAAAKKHRLAVIEDAAQAIGAEDGGRRAGSMGDYGCFSFFPSKNLGGAGDGGLVTTNDAARAERLRRLRNHGMEPKYYHALLGGNFRLDALQAVVVSAKLPHLDSWTAARQKNAGRYEKYFAEAGLAGVVRTPRVTQSRHVFNQYVVRVPRRDDLRAFLADQGVGAEVYYPVPLHRQECFAALGYAEGSMPESERAARETIALPVYPELRPEQLEYVVDRIAAFYRRT
jgi:dTDP-4-amino-4,6-dideoxygalactose transaminase